MGGPAGAPHYSPIWAVQELAAPPYDLAGTAEPHHRCPAFIRAAYASHSLHFFRKILLFLNLVLQFVIFVVS